VRPAELKININFPDGKTKNETVAPVAIYHLSVKTISRSHGRSATAAAAYRAATEITDERTGEIHDYTRKSGVEYTEIVLPANAPNWATDRSALWNAAEQAETRKNSTVAREFEIALPAELSAKERQKLAVTFAKEIVARHGVAADVAIHKPSRGGDNRNHHAHILITTRQLTEEGFTKKTRELDDRKSGEVDRWRERFAELQNESFKKNGIDESVDHRSLKDQGIEREPTQHLGVAATGYERRTGELSRRHNDFEKYTEERLNIAKEITELEIEVRQLEKEKRQIKHSIIELENIEFEKLREEKAAKRLEAENQAIAEYLELKRVEKIKETVRAEAAKAAEKFKEKLADKSTETVLNPQLEKQQPPKETTEQQEQYAQQVLIDFDRQLREKWRKKENEILLNEANKHRERHKELNVQEPKSLWKGDKWAREHYAWVYGTNQIRQELIDTLEAAKNALEGKSAKERELKPKFEQVARESLKKHHPELDQVLTNKAEREQQAREEQRQERLREQERQKQERKRSPSKNQDLER
jgi:hypothetical protein